MKLTIEQKIAKARQLMREVDGGLSEREKEETGIWFVDVDINIPNTENHIA